jgi:hypothetical protein
MAKRRASRQTEVARLERMSRLGVVSLAEADKALGRHNGFARWWASRLGLRFADGRVPLVQRLIERVP